MGNKQIFVKNLTVEEKNDILRFILDKFNLSNEGLAVNFYNSMVLYIETIRRDINTFKDNVNEILEVFSKCGYDNDEIMQILSLNPSLLHANKLDVFWRILILGKVRDADTGESVRDSYLLQNPRILRTSQDVTYARIKYLESDEAKPYLRKEGIITARQATKITNKEFEDFYHITKEDLINKYPFDNRAQLDVVSWEENKELLDNIHKGKSK